MIKLTKLLNEGLGPSSSTIKKIEDLLKKELKVSNVKVKKYSQGRARQGYTFYPEGTKNGLYIDEAYDGIWEIYTVDASGFPIDNHWKIKKYQNDIEDEATALQAAFDVIKKFGKTLKVESVNEESFTATNKASGKTSVFKSKTSRDAAVKAGTHDVKKATSSTGGNAKSGVNIFNTPAKSKPSNTPAKSKPFDADVDEKDFENALEADGFSSESGGTLDGVSAFADDAGNGVYISAGSVYDDEKPYAVSGYNEDDDSDTNYKSFDSKEDAIAYAKELGKKLKKQNPNQKYAPNSDEPESEPKKIRQGNPSVNKATKAKAEKLGITPQKLGKDEYQKKMAQAAVEALTDSNFHSEARALIASLEGKPEWAEKPTDMPSLSSPEYGEWRKNSVYSSEYYDADEDTSNLGQTASQESGWSGDDAVAGIAFTLRMNGFGKLADTIQSVIKEGKRTSLKNLMNEQSVNEGASNEEKKIVMMAISKIAKYRNVPLDVAVVDVIRAANELERTIKK